MCVPPHYAAEEVQPPLAAIRFRPSKLSPGRKCNIFPVFRLTRVYGQDQTISSLEHKQLFSSVAVQMKPIPVQLTIVIMHHEGAEQTRLLGGATLAVELSQLKGQKYQGTHFCMPSPAFSIFGNLCRKLRV